MRCLTYVTIFLLSISAVQANDLHIALLIKGLSNPYWKAMQDGALKAAKDTHVQLNLQGASRRTNKLNNSSTCAKRCC